MQGSGAGGRAVLFRVAVKERDVFLGKADTHLHTVNATLRITKGTQKIRAEYDPAG
jgi:hypothetical protein